MTPFRNTVSTLALMSALASVALAGCGQGTRTAQSNTAQPSALPLTTADTGPSAPAPLPAALPPAPKATVVRLAQPDQRYAYADRAYQISQVLGDAPPDYTFDYGGVRPWVWRSAQATQVVEPTPDGQRYYYYEPGASAPFLVRDPEYSYGYSNGQLVVVYDSQGRTLDPALIDERAALAGQYLYRARQLYNAALNNQRQAVAERNWQARRDQIDADRARWQAQQAQFADWRAYHDQHQAEQDAYWAQERDRRAAEAARYQQGQAYDQGRRDEDARDAGRQGMNPAVVAATAAAAFAAGQALHGHDRRDQGPPPPAVGPAPGLAPNSPPPPHGGFQSGSRPGDARQGGQDALRAGERAQAEAQARQQQAAAQAQAHAQQAQADAARHAMDQQHAAQFQAQQAGVEAARRAAEQQRAEHPTPPAAHPGPQPQPARPPEAARPKPEAPKAPPVPAPQADKPTSLMGRPTTRTATIRIRARSEKWEPVFGGNAL